MIGGAEMRSPSQASAPVVQMQTGPVDADEPPKAVKDPKNALEKVLKDWTKTKTVTE